MREIYLAALLSILVGAMWASPPLESRYYDELIGYWYEPSNDTELEIKYHRKGIKVREVTRGRRRGWDVYHDKGRGLFDNCDGRTINVTRYGDIRWKKSRWRRSVYLVKEDYRDRRYRGDRRYSRNRGLQCGPTGYDRYDDYDRYKRDYSGSWYCADERLYLDVELYGAGIRARRPNREWVYYNGDRSRGYSDRSGNRYFFDDDGYLCWQSRDRRRTHRFSRR